MTVSKGWLYKQGETRIPVIAETRLDALSECQDDQCYPGMDTYTPETVARRPDWDRYASLGFVPASALLDEPGFTVGCSNCRTEIAKSDLKDGNAHERDNKLLCDYCFGKLYPREHEEYWDKKNAEEEARCQK